MAHHLVTRDLKPGGLFRRCCSQRWLDLFESLTEFGAFHPGCVMETECVMLLLHGHDTEGLGRNL